MTTASKMMKTAALNAAKEVCGARASASLHRGTGKHWGIQIFGCNTDDAWSLGREIELALGFVRDRENGLINNNRHIGLSVVAGFACVWCE